MYNISVNKRSAIAAVKNISKVERSRHCRESTKMKITKDSLIGDVLDYDVETAQFFLEIGMHCLGCPSARGESIAQACAVHGTDADALVKKLNAFIEAK